MAENWKNNILPNQGDLDLGSLAYDDNTSLTDIAGKYQNLGKQVGNLANAAAQDVHDRQVKLIGNDFGAVDPMMYAAYYQPTANDIQSEMRMKGTEKALSEGMERGKAAAEAELEAAKNNYNNSLDAYKNAKDAFSNLVVATNDANMLPDGVTESDMMSFESFTHDRETARANMKGYTDAQGVDWSKQDIWSDAASKTITDTGTNTEGWGDSEWKEFWARKDVSRIFENNYVSEYIGRIYGEEKRKEYEASYTKIFNKIDEVFDYINNITDVLPTTEIPEIFYLQDNPSVKQSTGDNFESFVDNLFGGASEDDKYSYTLTYFGNEEWIREHVADEYQEEVLGKANQLRGTGGVKFQDSEHAKRRQQIMDANPKMSVPEAHSKAYAELGKEWYEYLQDKIKPEEANAEIVKRQTTANEVVTNLFGFSINDMKALRLWKETNPDEYDSFKNQLAQINALSNTMEVADGKRWYWTGKQYEQLKAGTPVFFAYNGAFNEDGTIGDEELKKFVSLWKDYYSADVEAISDEELTSKKEALNKAYAAYMEHVGLAITANSVFNIQITPDIYREIVAGFSSNISQSDYEIDGVKIKDIIKEFNEMDQAHKYTAFTELVKAAYSNTNRFYRYTDAAGGIVSEKTDYPDDSQASGHTKLDAIHTSLGIASGEPSKFANMTAVEAVPYFLAIARSMEQYNKGTTNGNIDPGFMDENFFQYWGNDMAEQINGTLDFWAGAFNFITGLIAAPVNAIMGNDPDPTHNELIGGKGYSAANVIGSAFSGTREYNMDDPRQRNEYLTLLDKRNREYVASVINPMLYDVYFGDNKKDISEVRGLGDAFTSEGGSFFAPRNWNQVWKSGVSFADMFAVNWLEGKAIGAVANGIGQGISAAANSKMAARLQLALMPTMIKNMDDVRVITGKITALSDTIGMLSSYIDNIDDPSQLYNALKNAVAELDDLGIDTTNIAKLIEKSDDLDSLKQAAQNLLDLKNSGALDDAVKTLGAIDNGEFGVLSAERAAALSGLSTNDLSTLLTNFGDFAKAASRNPSTKYVQQSLAGLNKITLATGETVSAFDATMVVAANRITGVMTLASATGLSAQTLAALPDSARQLLLSTLNGITSASDNVVTNRGLRAFLKSMNATDFKNLAAEFVSRAEVNAALGKKWDIFDTYRAAAAAGWERSGTVALAREFMTDALTDPLRDFKRNISVPQVDAEGNARVQTVQEYFTDPSNIMMNLGISAVHFGASRMYNQGATTVSAWRAKKAWDEYLATGEKTSVEATKLYNKAVKLNAKAQQYADKAWKRGMTYQKAADNALLSNDIVDEAVRRTFEASSWDLNYSGKNLSFSSKDEYIKFITDKNMPTKDGLYVLATSTNIKAINNFYMYRAQIGTAFNEVGNIPKASQLKLLNTFNDVYNDNIARIKDGNGDFFSKNHEMYDLMKNAALEANKAGEYGVTIRNLEKSLSGFFGNLEALAKNGLADGTLDQLRIGYIPVSSLYFDGSFDDMIQSHRMAATRGLLHEGASVDTAAANPSVPRDVYSLDSLLKAMNKGDKTYDVKDAEGNVVKTVQLDYDGTNLLDMMTVYSNNYNLHKYIDPIVGDSRTKFAEAYFRNNHAHIIGDWNAMQKAWNTDFNTALKKLTGWNDKDGIHHKGWNEIIVGRALADKASGITEEKAKELLKKHFIEVNVKAEDRENLTALRKEYSVAKKKLEAAKAIIENGDAPDSIYPIVSNVFNLDIEGVPNVKQAKEIVDNGRLVAKKLVKAYTDGDITEESLKTGYTLKTKSGYRDLFIDETMLQKLDAAAKNNGQIDSDLVFYSAIAEEIAAPYTEKSVDRGITTYKYVKGYKNRLEPVVARKLEVKGVSKNELVKIQPEDVAAVKNEKGLSRKTVAESNKEKAIEVFGNKKGEVTFGGKSSKDARTGKVTIAGGKTVDAAEFYGKQMRLGRNEKGDLIEKTSESAIKTAEDAANSVLYASIDTPIVKGEYKPTDFQKRYAESVVARTKTELADSGDSFDGSDWVQKIDKNAGEPKLVKAYGVDTDVTYTGLKDGKPATKKTTLARQVKALEQDGAMGAFKDNLDYKSIEVLSGKYDDFIPDGMTRQEVTDLLTKAREFMNTAEIYGTHQKKSDTLAAITDEEGNEISGDELYAEYASSDLKGNTEQIYGDFTGRTIDLSTDNVEDHLNAFKRVVTAYSDLDDPLHKIVTSEGLEALKSHKIDFNNKSKDLADVINDKAKALYDSGKNPEFNKMVDQAYQNIVARTQKYGGKAGENEIKYQYLEALGIAAPGAGLNSIGTGAYGQTTNRYYAAKTAEATGIEDMSVEGWSSEVTKARLQAGTNRGYAEQLKQGVERFQQFAGESKDITDLRNSAVELNSLVSSLVNAKPFGAEDNFENSIMAVFADVYDTKSMSVVANKAEIAQSGRNIKWRLDNLISETLTGKKIHNEGMTVQKVNDSAALSLSADKMIGEMSEFYDAHNKLKEAEYFTQYGKHDKEAVDPGITLAEATAQYDAALDRLYAQYGEGTSRDAYEDRLIGAKRRAQQLSDDYNELRKQYASMKGDNVVSPSAAQGKTSIFTPEQLSYATSSYKSHWIGDEKAFVTSIDGQSTRLRPVLDFGTAQELSDTAVGMTVLTDTGDELDLFGVSPDDAQTLYPKLNESLEDSGLKVVERSTLGQSDSDILQDLGNGYVLVGVPREDEPLVETNFSRGRGESDPRELADNAIAKYTSYTKKYNPAKQLKDAQKAFNDASKKLESVQKKGEKVSNKVKAGYTRVDDLAKKYLNPEEYGRYKADYDTYQNIKANKPTEGAEFYQAKFKNGAQGTYAVLSGKGSLPSGYVTLKTVLNLVGYDEKNFNHDISEHRVYTEAEIAKDRTVRKAMQREVNKNLRKGNVRYRNVEQYKNPSVLDIKSQTATINNLLAFADQTIKATGVTDTSKIAIDKDSVDLLYRISRDGIQPDNFKSKFKKAAFEVSDWNKFMQDFQLAGGASYINAMSIAQLRGAIFSNPAKMAEYLKLVVDFKDDAAVANFVVKNGKKLSQIAQTVKDSSILTDFQASASDVPGLEDGGTISAATYRMIEQFNNRKATERTGGEKYDYAKDAIQREVDAAFGDATFTRVLPVLRAKMLIANYDNAVKTLTRHFKNIDADTLQDAASKYSYARTTAFFEPNKTAGGFFKNKSINDTLDDIADDNLRRFLSSWTGAKDTVSIGQMTSNCFFALGYKQRMIQPLAQGAKSMFGIGNIADRLSMLRQIDSPTPELLNKLGTQFMQAGNRQQLRTLAFIAVGAFVSAKALGLATAWDDLSFIDEADGEFKVPDILKKFQTIGQIWIPNSIDENGNLTFDPKKPAFNIDTMSSIFTLPNTGWKTVDRIFNPNSYYTAPQRGFGFLTQMAGANWQPLNDFFNQSFFRGIGDELIGANLLSPYKAMYEVLVDSSYYGNNIWEKRWLSDGSENPNYDPGRNIAASFFHILGLDNYRTLSPRKYNDYVKGYYTDDYVAQDQIGSIGGAGLLQHEYITAVINILEGDALEGVIEAGELPIKKQTFSSTARTDFNTRIKNIIANAMAEYRNKTDGETNADVKDAAYTDAVKKSADAVASWSKKYDYVLGKDQSLVPYVTRAMMAVLAGEYDDRLDYIQNTYWKASEIAQIEASGPADYWLDDADVDEWLKAGKTVEEFAAEKNKRTNAYNEALDEEYRARKALHDAGIDNQYLAGMSYQNLKAEQRAVNKSAYIEAMGIVKGKVGEFDNFKEMKAYYEAQIDAATTKKAKAKLANQYNTYLTDALAPVVAKYGAGIISDGYYDNDYLSNHLADYVIIPADQYYTGKTPRASYLRDLFGVGYKNFKNEPSDDEVLEGYAQARKQMQAGNSASAVAALDRTIDAIKKGQLHVSDSDYSKIIRMRALLSARSK